MAKRDPSTLHAGWGFEATSKMNGREDDQGSIKKRILNICQEKKLGSRGQKSQGTVRYFNSDQVFVNDSIMEDKGEAPKGRSMTIGQFSKEPQSLKGTP